MNRRPLRALEAVLSGAAAGALPALPPAFHGGVPVPGAAVITMARRLFGGLLRAQLLHPLFWVIV